jgi:chromate transport protein ChrA
MSDGVFVELLALGTCMPGPTSTQMSFAIGVVQKGISGGLLSGLLFQYPGLLMMSFVGFGAGKVSSRMYNCLRGANQIANLFLGTKSNDGLGRWPSEGHRIALKWQSELVP